MKTALMVVSVSAWLVASSFLLADAAIPVTGDPVAGMASVDRVITSLIEEWDVPGCAVAIVKDGRLVFARGYGYADKETEALVQPDSLFRIASVSKPITAVTILKLVEQGKLDLDDKAFVILDHLEPPEGADVDSRIYNITIEHLLTHSGGWDTSALGYDPQLDLHKIAAEVLDEPRPADAEMIIRYMMGQRLNFTPGTRFAYSNFGYNVLGRVIEAVTGQNYESYVKSAILRPMGITGMRIGHTVVHERADGEVSYYDYPGRSRVLSVFPGEGYEYRPDGGWYLEAMDSHGGWIASPIDVMRFVVHVDGRSDTSDVLNARSIQLMTARPSITKWSGSSWYYAYGWNVRPKTYDANWWHTGSLHGSTCIVVRAYHGLSWFAVVNTRPSDSSAFKSALDRAMWDAVNGVTKWPTEDLF